MRIVVVIDVDIDKERLEENHRKKPFIPTVDQLHSRLSGVLYNSNAKIVDIIAGVSANENKSKIQNKD